MTLPADPPPPDREPVIGLVDVTRRFRSGGADVVAVDGLSLTVHRGEVLALVGPSGSGKTTVVHLLLGWEQPDDGTVERTFDQGEGWVAQAVVPQELGLLPELTVRENVHLAARLSDAEGLPVDAILGRLGLTALADRLPSELSVGEQQRAAVARAVSCPSTLIAADEPTAHQDERHAEMVVSVLVDAAATGTAVLLVTHDERLLESAHRVVTLSDGRQVSGAVSAPPASRR